MRKKSPVEKDWRETAKGVVKLAKPLVGKIGGRVLGPLGLVLGATKTATADQPKFPKGSKHYQDPKKKIDFTKTK